MLCNLHLVNIQPIHTQWELRLVICTALQVLPWVTTVYCFPVGLVLKRLLNCSEYSRSNHYHHLQLLSRAGPRSGVWGTPPCNPASLSTSVQGTPRPVMVHGGSGLQFCHYVSMSSHLHWSYYAFKCVLEENAQSVFLHADVCFCLMLVPEHHWAPCFNG